ncbi:enoyl-CoA hydratase/isomerase family protein [Myroides indicus]|uniref:Methylglutaconyl-CoA hydratase n=1 Tax=Myroides indicus TaxID=1323422 RepID=A0A4R7F409_9FLAO|nr:enoyl-CoA hydratase/isomerase family protein [Myroides indicus]TDS65262.1 methylglutaconyl-CoA hydratase [Myroides indicus]
MNSNMLQPYVQTNIIGKIATLTFFNPASNSFPSAQLQKLTQSIEELTKNKTVTVVVLQSAGTGAFCAGASFDELLSIKDTVSGSKFFSGFASVIDAMRRSRQIFIGRIHGKTVGGGVGLAAACDYCFATENAAIKLSELAIGIGPFVIEPAVSRKIGKTAFTEMSLAAHEWKTANWAHQNGLYAQIFSSAENMDIELNDFTNRISQYNPEALHEMKKIFWEGTDDWTELLHKRAQISGKLVLSDFTIEALNQFKNK